MPIVLEIDEDGLAALVAGYQALGDRAEDIAPVASDVRGRWLESERRLFARSPWEPKKQSTHDRYQRPMRHTASGRTIAFHASAPNPLVYSGLLRRTLTRPHEPGQLDSAGAQQRLRGRRTGAGGLTLRFGVKAQGPVAYGAFHTEKRGERVARDPFSFDARAHTDSAGDVVEYLIGRHSAR